MFQSITDAPRKRCPKCRKAVRRLIGTGSGILFKGSGFYCTDYGNKKCASSAPKPAGCSPDCPAKTGTKSEATGKQDASKKNAS